MMYGHLEAKIVNMCQYTPINEKTLEERKTSPLLKRMKSYDTEFKTIFNKHLVTAISKDAAKKIHNYVRKPEI